MLIPLNLKKASNLCLSVVKIQNKFSVAVVSVVNGYGLSELPSYMCHTHNDTQECDSIDFPIDACVCVEDEFDIFDDESLYKCIELALEQLQQKGYY